MCSYRWKVLQEAQSDEAPALAVVHHGAMHGPGELSHDLVSASVLSGTNLTGFILSVCQHASYGWVEVLNYGWDTGRFDERDLRCSSSLLRKSAESNGHPGPWVSCKIQCAKHQVPAPRPLPDPMPLPTPLVVRRAPALEPLDPPLVPWPPTGT
jgi:hypothetical protein